MFYCYKPKLKNDAFYLFDSLFIGSLTVKQELLNTLMENNEMKGSGHEEIANIITDPKKAIYENV